MKIVRFQDGSSTYWGSVKDDGTVWHMADAPFSLIKTPEFAGQLDDLTLAIPVQPGKIVCVGLNYEAHVTERDPTRKVPKEPVLFMKPPSALIGHGDTIRIANPENETHHEAELVVVIGRRARFLSPAVSLDYVLGYTCGNDVSDRDNQKQDGQFVRAKGYDTYAPIGPWIETDLDPKNLAIKSTVNDEVRQDSSTSKMLWPVDQLIAFISGVMTLEPGDLIMTGTPEGVGRLEPGDTCKVTIEKIGTLENRVVRGQSELTEMDPGPRTGGGGD